MPVFYFTTDDGITVDVDDLGVDFPDAQAAIDAAKVELADIAKSMLPDRGFAKITVNVTNSEGGHVYRASLTFEGHTSEQLPQSQALCDRAAAR